MSPRSRLERSTGLLMLTVLATLIPGPASAAEVTFRHEAPGASSVFLAGSFNGWSTSSTPLEDDDDDGIFEVAIDLADGEHQYKFVVDGQWTTDETAVAFQDDGYGGRNSIVRVAGGEASAAPPGRAVPEQATTGANPATGEGVEFRHEAPGASSVHVAGSFNGWSTTATPMTDAGEAGVFTVVVPLDPGSHQYKFVVDGTWTTDESAASFVDDGYGGRNSVVEVGAGGQVVGGVSASPATTQVAGETEAVTFSYTPVIGGERAIHLAGSFNGWSDSATPMTDEDGDGEYAVTLDLQPGRHTYKIVVEGQWLTDENAEAFEDDGFGGRNAVVVVGGGTSGGGDRLGDTDGLFQITFTHQAPGAREVVVAGEFNAWSQTSNPMADDDGDGTFDLSVLLPGGRYAYKFVADGNWTEDVNASEFVDDGFGGKNSVVYVDDRYEKFVLETGDGEIFGDDLAQPQSIATANLVADDEIVLRARAYRDDVERMSVTYRVGDGEWAERDMHRFSNDAAFDHYEATIRTAAPIETLEYAYVLRDGDVERWLGPEGLHEPGQASYVFDASTAPRVHAPDWVRDGVIYQIFPERFANGNRKNDPDFDEWYYEGRTRLPRVGKFNGEYFHLVKDWYDVKGLAKSPYRDDGKPDYFSFYGGDIEGVMQNLDYLEELGITIIYFNPVTEGRSNHKYDACDYKAVDPHFGGNEVFRSFVDAAHARGIRIVIDTVYNHAGDCHFAFKDCVEKGPDSPYWSWFEWKKWPLPENQGYDAEEYYACWWGFGIHPDLSFDLTREKEQELVPQSMEEADVNEELVAHLIEVAEFWIDDMDIDGFRLDVPNEVPNWFWSHFIGKVREMKDDAYVVAELWGDASSWIADGLADATMNYKYFKDPVNDWIAKGLGDAGSFDRGLAPGRFVYPPQSQQVMMNLIDSHDTIRFLRQAGGDRKRLMLAATFQMTYVGAPHIWYGDEVAMDGGADPDCRRPMYWKWAEEPERVAVREHYKKLIALRKELSALRRGSFQTLLAEGQVLAYVREDEDSSVLVVLNNAQREATVSVPIADARGITAGTKLADELGSEILLVEDGGVRVSIPPVSARVLSTRELRTEAR